MLMHIFKAQFIANNITNKESYLQLNKTAHHQNISKTLLHIKRSHDSFTRVL